MIKQAIIPLAGQGTRLLPLTSVLPKELLPINGKPGLEYILRVKQQPKIGELLLELMIVEKLQRRVLFNETIFQNYFIINYFSK